MSKEYLEAKQSIGIEPAADINVEAVGSCCLDVNGKSAYYMKGRGGWVWGMIWLGMISSIGFIPAFMLAGDDELGSKAYSDRIVEGLLWLSIPSLTIFGITLLWAIHIWRTRLPIRFNRKTRKVYLQYRHKIYISEWDKIRAYLSEDRAYTAQGVPFWQEQVKVEFADGTDKPLTIALMGTTKQGMRWMEGPAALWEYIRLYMEEGREVLPTPERDARSLREILADQNPLPIHTNHWFLWPLEIGVFFPIRAIWAYITYPTDILYFYIARRIKMNPYPPELAEPCSCEETDAERKKRLSELLSSYDKRIEEVSHNIPSLEKALPQIYDDWFVKFDFPGSYGLDVVDGMPSGWSRIALTDLVEFNPYESADNGDEICYLPISALPEDGMLMDRGKVEYRTTPTSIKFHNGDTLFPRISPWLDNGQVGMAEFLDGHTIACGSTDFIVMRGMKVSPEFTYCLATRRDLHEHLQEKMANATGSTQVELKMFTDYSVPMPPWPLFKRFEEEYAKPIGSTINSLIAERERLIKARERLIANT